MYRLILLLALDGAGLIVTGIGGDSIIDGRAILTLGAESAFAYYIAAIGLATGVLLVGMWIINIRTAANLLVGRTLEERWRQ